MNVSLCRSKEEGKEEVEGFTSYSVFLGKASPQYCSNSMYLSRVWSMFISSIRPALQPQPGHFYHGTDLHEETGSLDDHLG